MGLYDILLYGGIAVMGLSVIIAAMVSFSLLNSGKKIKKQLTKEYGKRQ